MSVTKQALKPDAVINQLAEKEKRWFAVYTKYKCEKYVAEHLGKKQIEVYLPIITKTKRYTRKVKKYDVPLINCYVFVYIDKGQYLPTLETEYVLKFLRQGKDLLAIPPSEIEILKRVSGDVEEVEAIDRHSPEPGEAVEVVSGHLAGMRGKILAKAGKKSFLVELKSIGFQLSINIDLKMLRTIEQNILKV
ncbi:MAG: UpxY family transcription antiterminator [Saprospiraceae bacterium]|nr:UpxY family transcription antiterminator [Saprospiraceae bacterium]